MSQDNVAQAEAEASKVKQAVFNAEKGIADVKDLLAKNIDFKAMQEKLEQEHAQQIKSVKEELQSELKAVKEESAQEIEKLAKRYKNFNGQVNQGGGVSYEEITGEQKEAAKQIAIALQNKSKISIDYSQSPLFTKSGHLKKSMMVSYDNTGAGGLLRPRQILGDIDINLQTINPVLSVVRTISTPVVEGALGYRTRDESYINLYEGIEGRGATEGERITRGIVDILMAKYSVKIPVSDIVYFGANGSDYDTDPILQEIDAINRKFDKIIARNIFNGTGLGGSNSFGVIGILHRAGLATSLITKIATTTTNTVTLNDIGMMGRRFKNGSIDRTRLMIDQNIYFALFNQSVADGHLPMEYFDFTPSGVPALRTPLGLIPIIPVYVNEDDAKVASNDGFANYAKFTNAGVASTDIALSGYQIGGSNQGKCVAILADFSRAYTLVNSTRGQFGCDDNFGKLLDDGFVYAGKIGFVGGNVTSEEAISILYVKN